MRSLRAPPSTDIDKGDLVVALRDGVRSPNGFPLVVPKKGLIYRCTGVYPEWYGLGCTLEGLNHRPYKGYFLVSRGIWYFRKVVKDNAPATLTLAELMQPGVGVGTPLLVPDEPEREDA